MKMKNLLFGKIKYNFIIHENHIKDIIHENHAKIIIHENNAQLYHL